MLELSGTLINVFQKPVGVSRSGEKYGGENCVQLQCSNTLKNGEKRIELVTMNIPSGAEFGDYIGKAIRVPVGAFVPQGGKSIQFYILPGAVDGIQVQSS